MQQFLATFAPSQQAAFCSPTPATGKQQSPAERCFTGNAPTLSHVAQSYGPQAALTWLCRQLYDLSEFSGSRIKFTEQQIRDTSGVIFSHYSGLKVTELMYFFSQFKSGKYGRFYGRVDGMIITEALSRFARERNAIHAAIIERIENQEREKQRQEHARTAITYQQWLEMKRQQQQHKTLNT